MGQADVAAVPATAFSTSTITLPAKLLASPAIAEVGMIGMIAGWLEDAIRAVPEGSRTIVAIQVRAGAGRCCCSRATWQLCWLGAPKQCIPMHASTAASNLGKQWC